MSRWKFVRFLSFAAVGAVLFVLPAAVAEESKLKCETIKGYKCDAKPDGTLYNCHNVTTEKCTVVSGPGSGKLQGATGTGNAPPPKNTAAPSTTSGVTAP